MNRECEKMQSLISQMADQELSADDRALLTEHLAACPECMAVYEAFAAISDVLGDLEEPPEGFTEAVMGRVKARTRRKQWMPVLRRAAGLAACLAVLVMAGRIAPAFLPKGGGNNTSASKAAFDITARKAADEAPAAGAPAAPAAPAAAPAPTPMPEPAEGPFTNDNDEAPAACLDEEAEISLERSFSSVSIFENRVEAPAEDFAAGTDADESNMAAPRSEEELARVLKDLLTPARSAKPGRYDREWDYAVTFHEDEERTVLIWVDGGALYCQDEIGAAAYYAKGTTAELLALLAELDD